MDHFHIPSSCTIKFHFRSYYYFGIGTPIFKSWYLSIPLTLERLRQRHEEILSRAATSYFSINNNEIIDEFYNKLLDINIDKLIYLITYLKDKNEVDYKIIEKILISMKNNIIYDLPDFNNLSSIYLKNRYKKQDRSNYIYLPKIEVKITSIIDNKTLIIDYIGLSILKTLCSFSLTNFKYGKTTLKDVLLGHKNKFILEHDLINNPFYGILKDKCSINKIDQLIEEYIEEKLIDKSKSNMYPLIKISEKGKRII